MFPKPEKKKKNTKYLKRKTPLKSFGKAIHMRRKAKRRVKRIVDEALLEIVRQQPCTACRERPPSDPDHITHRGAGGGDTIDNVMPLCRACHVLRHSMGWKRFFTIFPSVYFWLKEKGRIDIIENSRSKIGS